MSEKQIYQQKIQAQLDEWKADLDKLKAKASGASADAQLELQKQIKVLESKLEEGRSKFAEMSDASEESWQSIKKEMSSSWDATKAAFNDAVAKFKK
ncbi:coiled coil domain-containing protein [Motilimonas cestriensis]|uniref:Coiled coil domain-containing protein n=1 Tax=Motilimonas cestriensis TaxID=2742685 RepID=A0ABS8W9V2_9GAMM|nr:coiled coil domain-containing protein [Motilimonas cestriensis]MCE2595801.1 coiled coil domain-containing protein [Motilimonas cestriensis]